MLASEAAILNCSEKNAIKVWSKNLWGFIFRMFLKKCLDKIWFLITVPVDIKKVALREKGPHWEMFSSVLSLIWTEYEEILFSVVSPNAGNYETEELFRHFLRSVGLITVIGFVGLRHIRRTLNMYKYHRTKIALLRIDQQKKLGTNFSN